MSSSAKVQKCAIDSEYEGQRLDNYLLTHYKGVPKSRIYRAIRGGEVRINGKRVSVSYRLQTDDELRLPPLRQSETPKDPQDFIRARWLGLKERILFEDDVLLVLNKPAGIPVHGGTGESCGIIEAIRQLYSHSEAYELVHRLDKETSGCLLIAKKRSALKKLHQYLQEHQFEKTYWALVEGRWPEKIKQVDVPLLKHQLSSGERFVRVNEAHGKPSCTQFKILERFKDTTLVQAEPVTGRTHQIRVHAQYAGHPIVGDEKYGHRDFNRAMRSLGVQRLFLHAHRLSFPSLEDPRQRLNFEAPLEEDLYDVLEQLD